MKLKYLLLNCTVHCTNHDPLFSESDDPALQRDGSGPLWESMLRPGAVWGVSGARAIERLLA
jgi:hypothetical protein